jgi:hypothetical protein
LVPDAEIRLEAMLAQLCCLVATSNGAKDVTPIDFLLFEDEVEVSQENQIALIMATPVSKAGEQ